MNEIDVRAALAAGKVRFLGVELGCAEGALVPREETELLGRTALGILEEEGAARAIDMCCGAGNLACALAVHRASLEVWASDLTDGCVAVARRNVETLGLEGRVTVLQGDLFAPLAGLGLEGRIDAVVCNPPYISSGRLAKDRAALLEDEPREAFDGGPYGLSIHQRVVKEALPFLRRGGWLLFEIGLGQEKQVKILLDRTRAYGEVRFERDGAGDVRVVYARKEAKA
jgi:release factor glutamine methyltransferase